MRARGCRQGPHTRTIAPRTIARVCLRDTSLHFTSLLKSPKDRATGTSGALRQTAVRHTSLRQTARLIPTTCNGSNLSKTDAGDARLIRYKVAEHASPLGSRRALIESATPRLPGVACKSCGNRDLPDKNVPLSRSESWPGPVCCTARGGSKPDCRVYFAAVAMAHVS